MIALKLKPLTLAKFVEVYWYGNSHFETTRLTKSN